MQQLISFFITENSFLCNVFTFPLAFIEYSVLFYFIKTLFNTHLPTSRYIYSLLLTTVIGATIKILLPIPINLFINLIVLILFSSFGLKISIFESIIVNSLFTGLAALSEYIVNLFAAKILSLDILFLSTIPLFRIIFGFIIYFLIFIFISIFKYFKNDFKFSTEINIKEKFNIFLLLFSTLLLICPNLIFLILINMEIPTFYIIYNTVSAIIFFFLGTYNTYKLNKLQLTQRELETATLYNNTLSKLVDSNRAFRHDINNIINALGGYIELNDMEGLRNYYKNGLLPDIQKSNNLSLLNPDVINSPPLFGLFLAKYNYADSLGVKVELNSFFDYSTINMNIFDFVKIFGILLDNSIEAAANCDNKFVSIHITIDFYNRKQIFTIKNSYSNKDIDINKIFEKNFSTKEIKSGFGLWEVNQLLNKYKNVSLSPSKDDSFFYQKLEIFF